MVNCWRWIKLFPQESENLVGKTQWENIMARNVMSVIVFIRISYRFSTCESNVVWIPFDISSFIDYYHKDRIVPWNRGRLLYLAILLTAFGEKYAQNLAGFLILQFSFLNWVCLSVSRRERLHQVEVSHKGNFICSKGDHGDLPSKRVTPHVGVSGFLLFRVKMNIQTGELCHQPYEGRHKIAQGYRENRPIYAFYVVLMKLVFLFAGSFLTL